MAELQGKLPNQLSSSTEPTVDEHATYAHTPPGEKEASADWDKSYGDYEDQDEEPLYVNGEPVITSGKDVSKYLVDLRDDGDPPFTFRSVFLGTVIGGLGAALNQVCIYSTRFL